MNLYELNAVYMNIMNLIEDEVATQEEMQAALDQVKDDTETKLDGYGKIIRMLETQALVVKAEEERLKARRSHLEKSAKYMKDRVKDTLDLRGGDRKVKTPLFSFWVQKNPPALTVDVPVELLPENCRKVTVSADTAVIKDALLNGEIIPGCRLTQGESLRMK